MSAHLVERSEEDSFTAVARHVGELMNEEQSTSTELAETVGSRFSADCTTLVAEGRFADLLSRLLAQSDVLFSKSSEKDLECCIHVICHLASRVPAQQAGPAAQQVAQTLSSKADDHQEARLQGLSQLYNVLADAQLQYNVLLELLRYGAASGLAHHLVSVIRTGMDSWPAELQLSPAQTRSLYLLAADVLRSSKRKKAAAQRDAYKLTLKTLEALEGASAEEVATAKDAAATAAAEFIRSPEAFQFDLLETPALQQLQRDAKHGPVFELLSLLLSGDVQGFQSFADSNAGVFDTITMSRGDALTKMRLMALLGLGAKQSVVSYQDVQSALGVEEKEVESWIVRAIGKKLLDARIDQTSSSIAITRCSHRSFSAEQWVELRQRLAAWARNVQSIKEVVVGSAGASSGQQLPTLQNAIRA